MKETKLVDLSEKQKTDFFKKFEMEKIYKFATIYDYLDTLNTKMRWLDNRQQSCTIWILITYKRHQYS